MDFLVLGPLEVRLQGEPVPLGGAKPRAVLAVLLLHANEPVSAERLALALWGEDAPARAVKTVQVHVSRLRKALGETDAIETSAAGYCLRVASGELDAERFEGLAAEGRQALAAGEPVRAAELLQEALALWRGPPLADLAGEPFAQAEIARLDEQRLSALELRVDADLALGREAELTGELQHLSAANPTRERLVEQTMLALYRCGRQAEALEAYRAARGRYVAELGVEPGPRLRRLEARILRQDPALLANPAPELPRELERAAALPLEGRDEELTWLRTRWRLAGRGEGALVTVHGASGMGKSRLAAELAAEAHARGATVLYADGGGAADNALGVLAKARGARGPTLLVVDGADQAPETVRAELDALGREVSHTPLLAVVLDATGNGGSRGDVLVLAPLGIEAVHAIVTRYRPEYADTDTPDQWLLGASRGVPALVHELAGQWARREAARRVETGVERTAASRAGLRTMERELAADVVVLEAAREREPGDAANGAQVCPFKGLASFQIADAPYFFGRERLIAELVARLVGAPLLGIVGASGSGKSSVLRAGLLPALAAGVLPGSERRQVVMRPGAHPLQELRAALGPSDGEPVVLAVDQFEETFTICDDEQERAAFANELARLAQEHEGAGVVALAMRADFYGRCAEHPELSRLLAANHVLVGAMRTDELRRAVESPAERAGLIVDPELVDALVADVDGEPGALPLLSTALLELWQQREGRRLRHAAYERTGGVQGAVARLGEDAFARLDEAEQQIARRVLLRLVTVDDEGAVERRRVAPTELGGGDAARVASLLADRRLLTIHTGTVELAHEALLREWPRLRGWIQEDQDSLRVYRSFRAEAQEWLRVARDDGALLRGVRLAEAREWIDPEELTGFEREFLAAGLERDRRERQGRRRRLQVIIGALAVGLVAIGIVALVAIHQRRDAERQRNVALSRSLAVQSAQALDTDPELALRLALWADQTTPTAQSAAALRQATLAFRQLAELPADPQTARTAAYSPGGARIVTGGATGVAGVWDAATRRRTASLDGGHGSLLSARYAPDGSRIALGFDDGTVVVTDASLRGARTLLGKADAPVTRVAFSRDGARVAAARGDGTVHVVALEGDVPERTLGTAGDPGINGVDFDPGGRVATAGDDGSVKLFDVGDGEPSRVIAVDGKPSLRDVRFSPDGRLVVAVGEDGWARLWHASSGTRAASVNLDPRGLSSVAFSPDGRRFATAGYDGAVRIVGTDGAVPLLVLRGQLSRAQDVGFGATADRVVSAGYDGRTRVWDAGGVQDFVATSGPNVDNIDISPSGRWIATAGDDGAVRLWDPVTGALRRTLAGPEGYTTARFSPVGDELLIGRDADSSLLRWPLSAPKPRPAATFPSGTGLAIARFDPTGTKVIFGGYTKPVIVVRDLDSGKQVRLRGAPDRAVDAQILPGGRRAVVSMDDGELLVWRLDRPGAPERRLRGHTDHVNTFSYGPGGHVVSAGADRTVRVWNPLTGRSVVLRGHSNEVTGAMFTHDGRHVITTSTDGTVRLWDPHGGEALAVLEEGAIPLYDLALGRDGTIATLDGHEVVRVFRCAVCGSLAQVRALAQSRHPRALTAAERQAHTAEVG